ncbi:hypothetical protein [Cellulomonas sp. KRMCY2]|uniref:hypothetical protein n=1 Tax=Cellulomonas sp. KRMCY2 TaxID=1304865 RepID=UPI0012DD49ED|nr:hypothetical protein [Cellulomonas sp. KRMCY2]
MIDDASKVVFVRRSPDISHGNGFAGAASDACELVDRAGMRADRDDSGFPDPLRTVRREAREELGLDLSTREARLSTLGLTQVKSWHDLFTYVLVATARLAEPAERFRLVPGSTDDVEGTWELGSDAMVVDLKAALSDRGELVRLVRWLRSAEQVLPHATGSLLLLLAANLGDEVKRRTRKSPTLADLQSAVSEPPPTGRAAVPRSVAFQPLWAKER